MAVNIAQTEETPEPEVRLIPLANLVVDPEYQRDLRERWVSELVDEWDDAKAGLIKVSARPGGIYAIIAGQHRVEAMRRLGRRSAWAEVVRGAALSREADIFNGSNAMRLPHVLDRFRAAVVARKTEESTINQIVLDAGFRIAYDHSAENYGISSVDALKILHNLWGVLPETLDFIRRTWPDSPRAWQRTLLLGVGAVMKAYEGNVHFDADALSERVAMLPVTTIEQRARARAESMGRTSVNVWQEVAAVLVEEYNKHKKSRRLDQPRFGREVLAEWRRH